MMVSRLKYLSDILKKGFMNQIALLTPVFVLILWTFTIFLIMAYGRGRFMKDPQDAHTKDLKGTLPAWVERTGDNYNHLFEQPVAFYVVTLAIALINSINPLIIQAWANFNYLFLVLTLNLVLLRFTIFVVGWFIIAYMAISQLFIFDILDKKIEEGISFVYES